MIASTCRVGLIAWRESISDRELPMSDVLTPDAGPSNIAAAFRITKVTVAKIVIQYKSVRSLASFYSHVSSFAV